MAGRDGGGLEYEAFGARQRVRRDGRIVGYVARQTRRRWVAFAPTGAALGTAPRRREATALLPSPAPPPAPQVQVQVQVQAQVQAPPVGLPPAAPPVGVGAAPPVPPAPPAPPAPPMGEMPYAPV